MTTATATAMPVIMATLVALGAIVVASRARTWMSPPRRPGQRVRRRSADWAWARLGGWAFGRGSGPTDVDVAEWCEQVAASLRAGSSLTRAIVDTDGARRAGPLFPSIDQAIHRGRGLRAALDEVASDPSTPQGLVVPVLVACADLGGPAATSLERVAATLQARATERAERRANSAQARLSARVLTTVPFGVLALLVVSDSSVREALASSPGQACVALGGALNLVGWWWMRRIIGSVR